MTDDVPVDNPPGLDMKQLVKALANTTPRIFTSKWDDHRRIGSTEN